MTAGCALLPDWQVAGGGMPAAPIVILVIPCTEPTAPLEAPRIGVGTHMAAGDTFADRLSRGP